MSYLDKVGTNPNAQEDLRLNPNIPLQDKDSILKLWNVINSGKPYAQILEYVENEIEESLVFCFYSSSLSIISSFFFPKSPDPEASLVLP